MQKAIYQKPFKTVAEQIALLEGRGLSVDIDASDFAALPEWKGLAVPKWRPFFYQCALVYRFLKPTEKFVFDRDGWKDRLCKLLGEIPQNPVFDAKARAAIPDKPANSPFWV